MGDNKLERIAKTLGVNRRWLPPLEHATMIAGALAHGVCHVEHRGHSVAPLLVFEDGGSMDLPLVRWTETDRGFVLTSIGDSPGPDQTRHYDVCGTVDSIEVSIAARLSNPNPQSTGFETDTPRLVELLDDISQMIDRMARRRKEYDEFAIKVRERLDEGIRRKSVGPARERVAQLKKELPELNRESHASFVEKIEGVRDIAQNLEYSLTDYKTMALDIVDLIDQVRGSRNWDREKE